LLVASWRGITMKYPRSAGNASGEVHGDARPRLVALLSSYSSLR
jgi:hypothetical protein